MVVVVVADDVEFGPELVAYVHFGPELVVVVSDIEFSPEFVALADNIEFCSKPDVDIEFAPNLFLYLMILI